MNKFPEKENPINLEALLGQLGSLQGEDRGILIEKLRNDYKIDMDRMYQDLDAKLGQLLRIAAPGGLEELLAKKDTINPELRQEILSIMDRLSLLDEILDIRPEGPDLGRYH